jgi:TonB family protein
MFPHVWGSPPETQERDVMVISLGGAPGPRAGGMTPMGGRPVQEVAPAPPRPEPVRPPAAKVPEMIEPVARTVPKPKPAPPKPDPTPPPPRETLAEALSRTPPTRGEQLQRGSTVAQTGGAGIGIGLSTGGGGTGGEINVGDFCCPEYLQTLLQVIQRGWNSKQQIAGTTAIRFTIGRSGAVSDVEVAKASGYTVLDFTAQRAVLTARLPPLPAAYRNPALTLTINFEYQR